MTSDGWLHPVHIRVAIGAIAHRKSDGEERVWWMPAGLVFLSFRKYRNKSFPVGNSMILHMMDLSVPAKEHSRLSGHFLWHTMCGKRKMGIKTTSLMNRTSCLACFAAMQEYSASRIIELGRERRKRRKLRAKKKRQKAR